jgi:hypothetical protein
MASIVHRCLRHVPEGLRHRLIRSSISIPAVDAAEYTFKIAETREELEVAYGLLHDCYVGSRLMRRHPSGLRCTLFTALPYTTTIIAIHHQRVVGTVSLIRDSEVGFPSDKEYRGENDAVRSKGFKAVEVSAFAVDPEYRRRDHMISFYLMKFLFQYARRYMGCDMLVATVHPRSWDFYAALLGFKRSGREVSYGFVEGALAIHISLDLKVAENEWFPRKYRGLGPTRNLFQFMTGPHAAMKFPERHIPSVLDPVMTPEYLEYFFVHKTKLFSELSQRELSLIYHAYALHFDPASVPYLSGAFDTSRPFRYPMELAIDLSGNGQLLSAQVFDLSLGGAFIATERKLEVGSTYEATIFLGGETLRIPCVPRWCNTSQSLRHPAGYGVSFLVQDLRLAKCLRSVHRHSGRLNARTETDGLAGARPA